MKEIKFRAYDRIEERIYYDVIPFGEFVVLKYSQAGYEMLDIEIEDYDLIYSEDFSDYEIMQYTGLKDKNGVEIYEGDIVKWGHLNQWSREQPHRIAEVKFNPDIQFHSQVGVFNFGSFAYRDTTETDLEVIGNVYEDKLLEEQNK